MVQHSSKPIFHMTQILFESNADFHAEVGIENSEGKILLTVPQDERSKTRLDLTPGQAKMLADALMRCYAENLHSTGEGLDSNSMSLDELEASLQEVPETQIHGGWPVVFRRINGDSLNVGYMNIDGENECYELVEQMTTTRSRAKSRS